MEVHKIFAQEMRTALQKVSKDAEYHSSHHRHRNDAQNLLCYNNIY